MEDAIAAWDIAIASKAIGPPPAGAPQHCCHCHNNLQPPT